VTSGLRISEAELKTLLVTQLEVLDEAEFEKVQAVASRFKIPLEQAVVERGEDEPVELTECLGVAQSLGDLLWPVGGELLALVVVRDRLALFKHVRFRFVVRNLVRHRGLLAILDVEVRVLVVGVLVLWVAFEAGGHDSIVPYRA